MGASPRLSSARHFPRLDVMFHTETHVADNASSSYFADFELDNYPYSHHRHLYEPSDQTETHSPVKQSEPYPGISRHITETDAFFEEEEETLSSGTSVGDYATDHVSDDELSEGIYEDLVEDDSDYGFLFRIESAWETSMTAHPIPACRLAFAVSMEMAGLPKVVSIGLNRSQAHSLRQRDPVTHRHIKHRSLSKAHNGIPALRDLTSAVAIPDTCLLNKEASSTSHGHKEGEPPVTRTRFREVHDLLSSHSSASSDVESLQISSSSRHSYASTTPSSIIHDVCNDDDPIQGNSFEKFKQSLRSAEGRRTWRDMLDGISIEDDDFRRASTSNNPLTPMTESCQDRSKCSQIPLFNDSIYGTVTAEEDFITGMSGSHTPPEKQSQPLLLPMQPQDLSWIHEDAPQKLTYAAYDPYGSAPPTLSSPAARKSRSYQRHESFSSLFTGISDWHLRQQSNNYHEESRSFMHSMDTALGDLVARGESVKRSRWSMKRNHRRSLISS